MEVAVFWDHAGKTRELFQPGVPRGSRPRRVFYQKFSRTSGSGNLSCHRSCRNVQLYQIQMLHMLSVDDILSARTRMTKVCAGILGVDSSKINDFQCSTSTMPASFLVYHEVAKYIGAIVCL
jgi:hypothetical protein